jgi:Gas vesicle synthesis protein GvpL/GvpF
MAQAPLDGLRQGDLLAVFSRHSSSVGEPAPDALWTHERVVERLMADRAVLPMRFGSTLPDEAALARLLDERQASLRALLARIGDRVELGVRVVRELPAPEPAAVGAAPNGREWLLRKARDGRHADRAAAQLHTPLAALSADARQQPPRGPAEVLRTAYLVERRVVPRFRATVERLQRAHPDVAILCTGPWPAYSFVSDAAA